MIRYDPYTSSLWYLFGVLKNKLVADRFGLAPGYLYTTGPYSLAWEHDIVSAVTANSANFEKKRIFHNTR